MGAEIDRLEIQVEAQARSANSQLETLIGKLDRVATSLAKVNTGGLAGLANGVHKFTQASTGLSNVKTADFTRLAKNITTLSNLDAAKLYSASSAISSIAKSINGLQGVSVSSLQVSDIAKNISKLGGVNVQRAITNLPLLSKALNELLVSLSKAPRVSDNVIQMTNALAMLASQGGKVGTAANTVTRSLNAQSRSTDRATKSSHGLSSAIGRLYRQYFWINRISQKVWKSVESSMDFLETVNYFEVAMRKIGDDAVKSWDGKGYESAEAYANSFSERAKQLTAKMTGYEVDENGNATATGAKSLGMNPNEVMQWQAVYAQMSDSMGLAEETSLRFSKALTMLGADWASLRNLTFDQAWNKFASALSGQSRAVRSLGIDITNATLQEYAYKYGLTQAISEMNQATKAQLRLLAILDQSKVAYGDLANTISSPSNQLRMLQQNFSNLARAIGNLFLPVVSRTLPYVNALVISMQRLFSWIGSLLGIKFESINSSMGGMDDGLADMVGGAEDLGGALDDANKAAKALKTTTLGIDELNINNPNSGGSTPSGGGGGIGGSDILDYAIIDALDEYEKKWNEAFEKMDDKAQKFADKFDKYFEPLKAIIEDFAVGDYFKAGQDTSKLVAGIFDFFANAIDDVNWYKIGENIGNYLAGLDWIKILGSVGHFIWEGLKAGFELWSGAFSNAPIETTLVTLGVMPKMLKTITASKFATGIAKLAEKFKILGKNTRGFLLNLKAKGEIFTFNKGLVAIRNNLTKTQKGIISVASALIEFGVVQNVFEDLTLGTENVVFGLGKIALAVGIAGTAMYTVLGPAGIAVAAIVGVVGAISGINKGFEEIRAKEVGESIKEAMSNPGGTPIEELSGQYQYAFEEIGSQFDSVVEKSQGMQQAKENIDGTAESIELFMFDMQNGGTVTEEEVRKIEDSFQNLVDESSTLFQQEVDIIRLGLMGTLGEAAEKAGLSVAEINQHISSLQTETQKQLTDINNRFIELNNQLENGEIGMEEYSAQFDPLWEKYKKLSGYTDEATSAVEELQKITSEGIDWSKAIGEDGSVSTEYIQGQLAAVSGAASDAKLKIEESGQAISDSFQSLIDKAYANGDTEEAHFFENMLSINAQDIEAQTKEISRLAGEYTTTIQDDLINKIPELVNAVEAPNWTEAVLLGKNIGEERSKAIGRFKTDVVDPLSKDIDEMFGGLGDDCATYADKAFSDAMNQVLVFDNDDDLLFQSLGESFKERYGIALSEGIDGVSEKILPKTEEFGKDTVDGYNKGIDDNKASIIESMNSWMKLGVNAIHNGPMKFGSPSKTSFAFGADTVLGFNNGITTNTKSSIEAVNQWMNAVSNTMLSSLTSLESRVRAICDSMISSISGAVSAASAGNVSLNVNSLQIGGYAAGGFPDSGELFFARENGVNEFVGSVGGRSAVANNDQIVAGIASGVASAMNNSEQNELLREQNALLRALLEKDTDFQINGKSVLQGTDDSRRRSGFVLRPT